MRCGNDDSNIFRDSGGQLVGIIYPAICIICAFVLARRIRRRQQRKYTLPGGKMDTPSEKSGGEQLSSAANAEISYPAHTTHDGAPLPSACDILLPLSHSSPLPSSGYLAAVLSEERRNRMEQTYQHEKEGIQSTSSSCTSSGDFASVELRTDSNPPSGIESSPTQSDDSSQATSPSTRRSAEGDDRGLPSVPDSGEIQPVQKRSQQVQFLRDVDEEGVRTWRRLQTTTAEQPAARQQANRSDHGVNAQLFSRPLFLPLTITDKGFPKRQIPSTMTLTTYPATTDPSDLAALNLSRLINRLEHNLLSPYADLKSLHRSGYQRMRVSANIEYARATLQALERSLPQIKPVDRRHELQSTLSRNRQTLKQIQNSLDGIQAEEELRSSSRGNGGVGDDEFDDDDDADSPEDLLGTPDEGASTTDEATPEDDGSVHVSAKDTTSGTATTSTATVEASSSPTPTAPAPTPALRNRHHNTNTSSATATTTATSSSLHKPTPFSTGPKTDAETEEALSTDRREQENLTSSLLSLATQLKSSSQAFQASLDAEKSVLSRAAEGLDRTTGNLASAERRMGMLRRMTEGKGWWGRMMLYAWIFALWVVAVFIVFVGPKLRF
ncbi:hypothetical protein BDW62DRAFT_212348 [Aspergillus aurantiobrunneus]